MRKTMAGIAVVALTALGPYPGAGEAVGRDGEAAPSPSLRAEQRFRPAPIDLRGQRPRPEDLDAIAARAAERGSTRVILGLPLHFVPEGLLEPRAQRAQREAIAKAQEELLSRLGGVEEVVHRYTSIPFVNVVLSPSGVSGLAGTEGLASARLDGEGRPALALSTAAMGATTAQMRGFDGTGQTIAILDTGVDSSHPFLAGTVVDEACFGGCPNGGRWQIGPGSGVPLPSFISGFDHGTHVAGIAAGHRTPNTNVPGVAPGARIMSINVFHGQDFFCDTSPSPCATFYDGDVLAGLQHVFDRRGLFNIAAVNMSISSGVRTAECPGSAYDFAINNLLSVGIAPVAASANDRLSNAIGVPACVPGVISVGAVNNSGNVAGFSNSASFLDLLAPGVGVRSSVPGGGFAFMSGTSMATPHVSGSFALLKQRDPGAGVWANLQALVQGGPKVFDSRNGVLTARIRVDSALARPAVFDHDFTRDRAADIAVWRPTTHQWWILGVPTPVLWGDPGDVPVPADYDGNGTTDIAVFRAATHEWWIVGQPAPVLWGDPGDIPIPADYDGDGTIDIAVWRPSIGAWYVRGQFGMLHGLPTDIPVPADYDSDGRADLMLYRPSTGQWINLTGPPIGWGAPGDIPVPADYDGSGSADIAVFRPSTGQWFVRNQFTLPWGQAGDIPVPRDMGDGKASMAVWRPSTGQWIIARPFPFPQVFSWGAPTDLPL
jgi:subtilisin family serine protease